MNRRAFLDAFLAGGAAAGAALAFPGARGEVLRSIDPHVAGWRMVYRLQEYNITRRAQTLGAIYVVEDPPKGYPDVVCLERHIPIHTFEQLKRDHKTGDHHEVIDDLLRVMIDDDVIAYRKHPELFYPELGQLEA